MLLVAGVVLVGANLRVAVTALGALLAEVSDGLGMSATVAGVVTMMPTLSFAVFGLTAPWLARRIAPARIMAVAMVLLAAGQALRAATDSVPVFVFCSAAALSGIAVANVLLPALVKEYFPDRVGLMTGVYSMTLVVSTAGGAAAAVPVAQLAGSWRVGLGAWAVLAALAVLPWLPTLRRPRASTAGAGRPTDAVGRAPARRIRAARTRLGWATAVFFGSQSLVAYAMMGWLAQLFRDHGFPATQAGLLLALVHGLGVPGALVVPSLAGRWRDLRGLVVVLTGLTGFGLVGLMVAPRTATLLWVVVLAVGQAVFPLVLAMMGMRTRTPEGTVALSAFSQSVGYLLAGLGPLVVGVLYDVTGGGWTAPLIFLVAMTAVQTVSGWLVARPRYLEDELAERGMAVPGSSEGRRAA